MTVVLNIHARLKHDFDRHHIKKKLKTKLLFRRAHTRSNLPSYDEVISQNDCLDPENDSYDYYEILPKFIEIINDNEGLLQEKSPITQQAATMEVIEKPDHNVHKVGTEHKEHYEHYEHYEHHQRETHATRPAEPARSPKPRFRSDIVRKRKVRESLEHKEIHCNRRVFSTHRYVFTCLQILIFIQLVYLFMF